MDLFEYGDPYIEWEEEISAREDFADRQEPEYEHVCLHCLSKTCVGNCPESEIVNEPEGDQDDGLY